jgi:hypothetical protein
MRQFFAEICRAATKFWQWVMRQSRMGRPGAALPKNGFAIYEMDLP